MPLGDFWNKAVARQPYRDHESHDRDDFAVLIAGYMHHIANQNKFATGCNG